MKTVCGTWYEVVMTKGYGCKLPENFNNRRDAFKAIKKANEIETTNGYKPSLYYVVLVQTVRNIDENGDVIFETITRIRIEK